jgi:hypothetical protein
VADQIENLIQEIGRLKAQWVAEVGEGRRKWPRSIKERVEKLDDMGMPAKQISIETGIGYETLLTWRFTRRQKLKKQFHQVQVEEPTRAIAKIDTVTVPKISESKKILEIGTVTVTTPDGFKIEALDIVAAIELLKGLRCS